VPQWVSVRPGTRANEANMNKLIAAATLVGLVIVGQGTAHAVPILQLYVEGAYYDPLSESWVAYAPSSGEPFRLWAIGNVLRPRGKGSISGVRLSVAYDAALFGQITISLDPTQIGGDGYFDRFVDPTVPDLDPSILGIQGPQRLQEQRDGTILPKLSDGSDLPNHGAFGLGVSWQEFLLGNFSETNSTIADFIQPQGFSGPPPFDITDIQELFDNQGQINAYDVTVAVDGAAASGVILHFDLYDNIQAGNKVQAKFAPFSHDVEMAPEPASFIVWFLIGLSWAGSAWTHQYRRRWQKWQREEAMAADGSPAEDQVDRFAGRGDDVEGRVSLPTLTQFAGGADGPSAGG